MHREPVTSSTIISVGYEPRTQTLEIEFQSGRTYQYKAVPPLAYKVLMSSYSVGVAFAANIRNRYEYEEVTGAGDPTLKLDTPTDV